MHKYLIHLMENSARINGKEYLFCLFVIQKCDRQLLCEDMKQNLFLNCMHEREVSSWTFLRMKK